MALWCFVVWCVYPNIHQRLQPKLARNHTSWIKRLLFRQYHLPIVDAAEMEGVCPTGVCLISRIQFSIGYSSRLHPHLGQEVVEAIKQPSIKEVCHLGFLLRERWHVPLSILERGVIWIAAMGSSITSPQCQACSSRNTATVVICILRRYTMKCIMISTQMNC